MKLLERLKNIQHKMARWIGMLLVNRGIGLVLLTAILMMAFSYFSYTFGRGGFFDNLRALQAYLVADSGPISNLPSDSVPSGEVSGTHSVFASELEPIYGVPKRLVVESVGIALDLVKVGVDRDGTMETPQDWASGGWYKESSRAGQPGNLIINAHYDNSFGGPAAFFGLKNVTVGDKVLVVDSYGRTFSYSITDIFHVGLDDPDKLDILDSNGELAHMTLITCGGVWVSGKATYNKRLVVTAELVE